MKGDFKMKGAAATRHCGGHPDPLAPYAETQKSNSNSNSAKPSIQNFKTVSEYHIVDASGLPFVPSTSKAGANGATTGGAAANGSNGAAAAGAAANGGGTAAVLTAPEAKAAQAAAAALPLLDLEAGGPPRPLDLGDLFYAPNALVDARVRAACFFVIPVRARGAVRWSFCCILDTQNPAAPHTDPKQHTF